jgi:hypothetical protein
MARFYFDKGLRLISRRKTAFGDIAKGVRRLLTLDDSISYRIAKTLQLCLELLETKSPKHDELWKRRIGVLNAQASGKNTAMCAQTPNAALGKTVIVAKARKA